jgi:hypothetical protein
VGKQYTPINLIHINEKYRKSFIAGLFLIGMGKLIDYPLIIGDYTAGGGQLSINGKDLVKSLKSKKTICIKALDLKTGKEQPLTDVDLQNNNTNITFVLTTKNIPLEYAVEDFEKFSTKLWIYENPEKEDELTLFC